MRSHIAILRGGHHPINNNNSCTLGKRLSRCGLSFFPPSIYPSVRFSPAPSVVCSVAPSSSDKMKTTFKALPESDISLLMTDPGTCFFVPLFLFMMHINYFLAKQERYRVIFIYRVKRTTHTGLEKINRIYSN